MAKHYLTPTQLIHRKQTHLLPGVHHFYRRPPHMVRGRGVFMYDSDDREYLDLYAGVSVNALGHADPEMVAAVSEQMATLAHTTTIYLTQPMLDLAARLADLTPGALQRSFFCSSGSEANETAAILAAHATGREHFLALRNSLHGNTKLTNSLTGLEFWRTDPKPLAEVDFLPAPYCFRCPFGRSPATCDLPCAAALAQRLEDHRRPPPAAMIVEPVQGNGGIVVPPARYMQRIASLLRQHGVLLIADEVQTGFGRTGRMFACEHFDIHPDILTFAKALGGGLPAGGTITTDAVARGFNGPRAATFGGNLVTMRAALTVLDALQRRGLLGNARTTGAHLRAGLQRLQDKHPVIGDVRGLGLMQGAELVDDDGNPAADLTDAVLEQLKDGGILIGKTGAGRNVLTFQPPLIISPDHIDHAMRKLDDVLTEVTP